MKGLFPVFQKVVQRTISGIYLIECLFEVWHTYAPEQVDEFHRFRGRFLLDGRQSAYYLLVASESLNCRHIFHNFQIVPVIAAGR